MRFGFAGLRQHEYAATSLHKKSPAKPKPAGHKSFLGREEETLYEEAPALAYWCELPVSRAGP